MTEREELRVYKRDADEYQDYLNARFPISGITGYSFEWKGRRWQYKYSDFDDSGEFDLLLGGAALLNRTEQNAAPRSEGTQEQAPPPVAGPESKAPSRPAEGAAPITQKPGESGVEKPASTITASNGSELAVLRSVGRSYVQHPSMEAVLKAVDDEPELPGDPPLGMVNAIVLAVRSSDNEFLAETLRTVVRLTKRDIRERINALAERRGIQQGSAK